METIKILVVDDHIVVRDGLSSMMSRREEFTVVGEASNGLEAVERARELKPDVVLMDLRMPVMDGVEAMRLISQEDPDVKFIVLTTFDGDDYIFDAIEAGAKAYLLKDASRDDLFRAVRAVNQGDSLIEPGVASKVLDRLAQLSPTDGAGLGQQADRRVAVSEREYGQDPHRKHILEAGCQSPHRGGDPGAPAADHKALSKDTTRVLGQKTDHGVGLSATRN